jgi:hypothetical protein
MESLLKPTVVEYFVDRDYQPPLPGMRLRWDSESFDAVERRWYLPKHLVLTGPAPERFGITVDRRDTDSYDVRVLWDQMCLTWKGLSRVHLLTSALTSLLRALDQDLWQLLNQPVHSVAAHPGKVA